MDIFRERELLSNQENDLEQNSRFDSLPIPKRRYVKKLDHLYVGETVWLEKKGPRVITSVNMQNSDHVHYITLAEEYGRFDMDSISKYKVIEHLDFIDSVKSLEWEFIYKYGLPLCLIPMELTFIAFCIALEAEIAMFHTLGFNTSLLFVGSTFFRKFCYIPYSKTCAKVC